MNAYLSFVLTVAGFSFLAASLVFEKKAEWTAVAGLAVLLFLAVRDCDPLLALGVLALVVARCLRTTPPNESAATTPEEPAAPPGKHP